MSLLFWPLSGSNWDLLVFTRVWDPAKISETRQSIHQLLKVLTLQIRAKIKQQVNRHHSIHKESYTIFPFDNALLTPTMTLFSLYHVGQLTKYKGTSEPVVPSDLFFLWVGGFSSMWPAAADLSRVCCSMVK